jgi:hypothetical protein
MSYSYNEKIDASATRGAFLMAFPEIPSFVHAEKLTIGVHIVGAERGRSLDYLIQSEV